MPKITFSHNYPKLWKQTQAELIRVSATMRECLDDELIEYDTLTSDGGYYKLPDGCLIHLTFLGNYMIPFSTIRPFTEEKLRYYTKNKGKLFSVIAPYGAVQNELF